MQDRTELLNKVSDVIIAPEITISSRISRWQNVKNLFSLADIVLIVAVVFGIYFLLIYEVVCRWKVMPVDYLRLIEMKSFLDRNCKTQDFNHVYFLGSSIPLEGIDCDCIDPVFTKNITCYNLSWTGGGPRQWLLMLPSLRQTRPSSVVIVVDVGMLMPVRPIPDNLMIVAAWWNFIPEDQSEVFLPLLNAQEKKVLKASVFRHLLDFRSFPPDALNTYMVEISRKDLRYEGYAANYKAPWVRKASVSAEAIDRGVQETQRLISLSKPQDIAETLRILDFIINYLKTDNCKIKIIYAPVHPLCATDTVKKAVASFKQSLTGIAQKHDVAVVDHSELLTVDDFSDHIHPNAKGRLIWSKQVGRLFSSDTAFESK